MALHEIPFPSANGRDEIQAWMYVPVVEPRAIVQIVHGLGEHSRRYLPMIVSLMDAGFVVVADDHAGHGRTAMIEGTWGDSGDGGDAVAVTDELTLQSRAREMFPDLPYIVFGHSWGSIIARCMAMDSRARLDGLALCGIASRMRGIEEVLDRPALARLAQGEGAADPVPEELLGEGFAGFGDRFGPDAGPTAWVAADEQVVADHGRDPFNNFGAPLSARFLKGLVDLYDKANSDAFYAALPSNLRILIFAGDQDPVTGYGEGVYLVANRLWATGHHDVRTRVFPGLRHEVHNEPSSRREDESELIAFVERAVAS